MNHVITAFVIMLLSCITADACIKVKVVTKENIEEFSHPFSKIEVNRVGKGVYSVFISANHFLNQDCGAFIESNVGLPEESENNTLKTIETELSTEVMVILSDQEIEEEFGFQLKFNCPDCAGLYFSVNLKSFLPPAKDDPTMKIIPLDISPPEIPEVKFDLDV